MSAAPDPDTAEDQAAAWLMRLNEGPVGLEAELELELWLDAQPQNRAALRRLADAWRLAGDAAHAPGLIAARADALGAMRDSTRRGRNRLLLRWAVPAAVAACLVLALVGSLSWFPASQIYRTAVGERRMITLADGSRISLDAATAVEVRYERERRDLRLLSGRARFDVAKDPRRPFTVTAQGHMVVATGTAFSVELVRAEMRVVLYQGSVAVLEDGPADQAPRHVALDAARGVPADRSLVPGKALTVAAGPSASARIDPVDPIRSLSWEQGQLVFSDEPLGVAIERVNRYSATRLVARDPRTAALPVSGAFNAGDTEAFVEGVESLYGLHGTRQGDTIVLEPGRR